MLFDEFSVLILDELELSSDSPVMVLDPDDIALSGCVDSEFKIATEPPF